MSSSLAEAKKRDLLSFLSKPYHDTDDNSQIARFYNGKSVFITGATGFIGKALVEKLLRSCVGIRRMYLLVRPRHGKSSKERLEDILKSPIFVRLKDDKTGKLRHELLAKLCIVAGDITRPAFGIREVDMSELRDSVNIVFNSAATIKFMEPIENAVRSNINSVEQLVLFCSQLDKLEALVHLSTAYSNSHKLDKIQEIFYEPPMRGDQLIEAVSALSKLEQSVYDCSFAVRQQPEPALRPREQSAARKGSELDTSAAAAATTSGDTGSGAGSCALGAARELPHIERGAEAERRALQTAPCARQRFPFERPPTGAEREPRLLREFTRYAMLKSNRPNTYTFTKAVAESYLCDMLARHPSKFLGASGAQVAIARPAIVGSAWRQPLAGFVDNFNGATGGISSVYVGVLQAMPGVPEKSADIVPVDVVVDCVIASAWFAAQSRDKRWLEARLKQVSPEAGSKQADDAPAARTPRAGNKRAADKVRANVAPFADKGIYIFNIVSGNRNPLKWAMLKAVCDKFAFQYPTDHVARLPTAQYMRNGWRFELFDLINHKLPAHAVDFVSRYVLCKKLTHKTSAVAMYRRVKSMTDILTPFSANEWKFDDSNTSALFALLSPIDKRLFNFDITSVDWLDYLDSYAAGTRVYALRDPPDTMASAVRKINRFKAQRQVFIAALFALFAWLVIALISRCI